IICKMNHGSLDACIARPSKTPTQSGHEELLLIIGRLKNINIPMGALVIPKAPEAWRVAILQDDFHTFDKHVRIPCPKDLSPVGLHCARRAVFRRNEWFVSYSITSKSAVCVGDHPEH